MQFNSKQQTLYYIKKATEKFEINRYRSGSIAQKTGKNM